MLPKLSIIMPVVDVPHGSGRPFHGLRDTLESVLGVDANYELLIGADGQQDRIKEMVDSFHSDRARYFEYEFTGRWGNYQRNRLIQKATGTHITYLDHDDVMEDGGIEMALEYADLFPDRPVMYQIITREGYVKWHNRSGMTAAAPLLNSGLPKDDEIDPYGKPPRVTQYIDCSMGVFPINGVVRWEPETEYNADWVFLVRTLNRFARMGKQPCYVQSVIKKMCPIAGELVRNAIDAFLKDEELDVGAD